MQACICVLLLHCSYFQNWRYQRKKARIWHNLLAQLWKSETVIGAWADSWSQPGKASGCIQDCCQKAWWHKRSPRKPKHGCQRRWLGYAGWPLQHQSVFKKSKSHPPPQTQMTNVVMQRNNESETSKLWPLCLSEVLWLAFQFGQQAFSTRHIDTSSANLCVNQNWYLSIE